MQSTVLYFYCTLVQVFANTDYILKFEEKTYLCLVFKENGHTQPCPSS